MNETLQAKGKVAEQIREQNKTICCLQEIYFRFENTYRMKVKEWKRYSMEM